MSNIYKIKSELTKYVAATNYTILPVHSSRYNMLHEYRLQHTHRAVHNSIRMFMLVPYHNCPLVSIFPEDAQIFKHVWYARYYAYTLFRLSMYNE